MAIFVTDEVVTAAKLNLLFPAGPDWQAWTPTLTNLTLGSGSVVARYLQIGKTVVGYFRFTYGSGSAVGTNPTFSLPISSSASYSTLMPLGSASLFDSGTAVFKGHVRWQSSTTAIIDVFGAAATYVTSTSVTATVPFTWTTNDARGCSFTYEVA
jgi:hypothetical protein